MFFSYLYYWQIISCKRDLPTIVRSVSRYPEEVFYLFINLTWEVIIYFSVITINCRVFLITSGFTIKVQRSLLIVFLLAIPLRSVIHHLNTLNESVEQLSNEQESELTIEQYM